MKPLNRQIIFCLSVVIGIVLFGKTASATNIYINPSEQTVFAEETFLAEVYLDSEREIINAVQTQIAYPTNYLEVVDLAFGNSFLTIWPEQPNNNSQTGIISFTGGVPGGSYVFDSKVLTITFRAKHTGSVSINFINNNTEAYLNDGAGTSAKINTIGSKVTILTPSSQAITLSSPTHPDQDRWYPANDFMVTWEPRIDSFYSYILSADPEAVPDQIQEEEVGNTTFHDLKDGIYYFILYEKPSGEAWEYTGRRRVMVDQTAPLSFEIQLADNTDEYKENKAILFATTDAMSGIDHYDVLQGEKLFTNVSSPYSYQIDKPTNFTVRAYDKAGNLTEAGKLILAENENNFSNFAIILIVIIVLLIIILFIVLRSRSKDEDKPQLE
ncbi:MAG: cohesin domain-containing protein [Patescibacteria group bacterium]|jgi:hypothetical protein